jgi:uncharacterized protein involved in response to NO
MAGPSHVPAGIPAGAIIESDPLLAAPMWRREPYLLLFPLGVALSWAGILHWLLHALGLLGAYKPVFHALTQVQGFLMSFALGFLFTMIPRRTGSAPPSAVEMTAALAAPPAVTIAAWQDWRVAAQIAWLLLAVMVIAFAVRRFLGATSRRRPPNAFVWIPLALAMGVAGSVLIALEGRLRIEHAWWIDVGRGLLLQGMFTSLVLGVGTLALPLMTRGEAPPDAASTGRDAAARAAHVAAALLLAASFWIGARFSLQAALLLRGAVSLGALLLSARIWRRPRAAWNARVIWTAAWMVPLGYLLAAAFPDRYRGPLHVTFVGGFALLALAVSTQVTLGHGGRSDLLFGRPRQVLAIATLTLLATAARVMLQFDVERGPWWMAMAAGLFLTATIVWAAFLLPKIARRCWSRGLGPGP